MKLAIKDARIKQEQKMLSEMVKELYAEWETPVPPQDVPGIYTVRLEEGVSFTISSYANNGIVLNTAVAEVSPKAGEEFFAHLLYANLFGQGTKGATIGLNESGNLLTLSHLIEYDVNFKEFRDFVEDFINTMDFWRNESKKYL
jgi:hypothetical protein